MTSKLAGAFDALEHELAVAATRLSLQTARRRRHVTISAILVSGLLALTGAATASGLVHIPVSPGDDPTANHAASALGLSISEAAVLLKAQDLGKIALACQIAHGATEITNNGDHGLTDPGGVAAQACKAQIDANENFLNSAAFREAMTSAQPRILAAAHCFQSYTGIKPGTVIETSAASQAAIDAGNAACYQPNGLPK